MTVNSKEENSFAWISSKNSGSCLRYQNGGQKVTGELAVAPFSLLNNINNIRRKRAITASGSRFVFIMEIVPRFLLRASSSPSALMFSSWTHQEYSS